MNPDEQITTVEISKYYKYTYVVAECNPLRYFLFVKFTCSIVCKPVFASAGFFETPLRCAGLIFFGIPLRCAALVI